MSATTGQSCPHCKRNCTYLFWNGISCLGCEHCTAIHKSPEDPPVVPAAFGPPLVCTGSQTWAIDLQGRAEMADLPSDGVCGICYKRVPVDGHFRCVTHTYTR